MTAQQHDRPGPLVERSFTAVRAALPAENAAAFDAEFARIAGGPVTDFAAVDEFLAGWHRIAARIAGDPGDWKRVLRLAADLESGARQPGRPMAEVLAEQVARRGLRR
jgi:hypothetical protein